MNKTAISAVKILPDAILVGRHVSSDLPYNIIEQRSVVFSTDVEQCVTQVEDLFDAAYKADAFLLFQNIPGIVACALTRIASHCIPTHLRGVGVILSKPGPRLAGVEYLFDQALFNHDFRNDVYYSEIERLAKHCNPNAKVTGFTVTVDPLMKFEFDKIEWLF